MKVLNRYVVNLNIPHGQTIRLSGQLYRYLGRARDKERRHLFESDEGLPADFSDEQIIGLQQFGELEMLTSTEAESARLVADGLKPMRNFETATKDERAEVARIMKYIQRWEDLGCPPRTEAVLGPLIADVSEQERDNKPPSCRTLGRKLARWIDSNRDVESLLRQTARCGNREDRIEVGIKSAFRDLIERYYLADQPETVASAYLLAKDDWEEAYQHLPPEERPSFPGLSSAYAVAREIDLFTRKFCRDGEAIAERQHSPVDDGPVVKRHNEAWEIDHTTLDVIVVDENSGLPLGRPTLTMILDRHSRAIAAAVVTWDAPGMPAVADALRQAINPKNALLEKIPNLLNPWPVFGVPDEIVSDNAAEFKSRSFQEICQRLGVRPSRSPVLKAWYRGRIERGIKTLVYSTCHTVPGTTYANIFKRDNKPVPEKVAFCTKSQLEEMIIRWIVDVYHVRRHRTLNDAPIRIYQQSVQRNGTKPLPDPERLNAILSLVYYRKVHAKGLVFEDLWYHSDRLGLYGTLPNVPRSVSVKVDPNDLTRIWYFDVELNDYVECRVQRSMRERVQGITLAAHKMARALQRSNPELLAGEKGLSKAYSLIRRSLEEDARGRDGLTNRKRAMRKLSKLRAKAAAMFEDAPAFDRKEENLVDDLFGADEPEQEQIEAEAGEVTAGEVTAGEQDQQAETMNMDELVESSTPTEKPKKQSRVRRKASGATDRPEKPSMPQTPPAFEPDESDDLSSFDQAVNTNLFLHGKREDGDV